MSPTPIGSRQGSKLKVLYSLVMRFGLVCVNSSAQITKCNIWEKFYLAELFPGAPYLFMLPNL